MSEIVLRGAQRVGEPATGIGVADGRIVSTTSGQSPPGARRFDATGLTAVPGFIDLQVNGAAGLDITSEPEVLTPELDVAATLVAGEVAWASERARWA